MLVTEEKIIVCCPQAASGGPELLHQLVGELRRVGRDAYIAYYPFDKGYARPRIYNKYNTRTHKLVDEEGTFILVPETATGILRSIRKARAGVWWLSVDNYFMANHKSRIRDLWIRYQSLLKTRLPLYRMKDFLHFSQSYYAAQFLAAHSLKSSRLGDFLADEHLSGDPQRLAAAKENIVLYNPLKGLAKTQALMKRYSDINFQPIQGLGPAQVVMMMRKAKLYIDFGSHPGKDRLPREAAIAGCCVITGIQGSARNDLDVPVPRQYKLNDDTNEYIEQFGPIVASVFDEYDHHLSAFEPMRASIRREPALFRAEVRSIFAL